METRESWGFLGSFRRNIGRFATIKEGLPVGQHVLTCELLRKTSDPNRGTEFRLIGVMRSVNTLYTLIRQSVRVLDRAL